MPFIQVGNPQVADPDTPGMMSVGLYASIVDDYIEPTQPQYELRLARTAAELESAFRIRYRAYRSISAIPENETDQFSDEYDRLPTAKVFLLLKDGAPIGSTRTLVFNPEDGIETTSFRIYRDEIKSTLGLGSTIVEANRLVLDPDFQSESASNLYRLFKAHIFRCRIEDAQYFIGAVRKDHVPFYRRMLKMQLISEYKTYPGLTSQMALMVGDFKRNIESVEKRLPLLVVKSGEITYFQKTGIIGFNHE